MWELVWSGRRAFIFKGNKVMTARRAEGQMSNYDHDKFVHYYMHWILK